MIPEMYRRPGVAILERGGCTLRAIKVKMYAMSIPYQKNFYDRKRYFQGKDNPDDVHPEPKPEDKIPMSQILIGLAFLAFVGLLFMMSIRAAKIEGQITAPKVDTTK